MKKFKGKSIRFPRPPLEGYPWGGKFTNVEEIREYFLRDKLICLLCGRAFKQLARHLDRQHQIDFKEYGKIFGLILHKDSTTKVLRQQSDKENTVLIGFENKEIMFPRPPLEGYPWDGKFTTPEEIQEYFAHDEITCLLCGRSYLHLSLHLFHTHKVSHERYREIYGLPWMRGLVAIEVHEKLSANTQRLIAEGILIAPDKEILAKAKTYAKKQRPKQEYQKVYLKRNRNEILKQPEWEDKDFDELLRRIAKRRLPKDVCKDSDMPAYDTWVSYRRQNHEYDKKFHQLWDTMSFSFQVETRTLGKRFEQKVKKLYEQGLSECQIAKELEVSSRTVNRHLKKLIAREEVVKKKWFWTQHDYELFLDRVAEGRFPKEICKGPDMPSLFTWYKYRRENSDYDKRFKQILESLPYSLQAKSRSLGRRFEQEAKKLYEQGLSECQIAKELGVSHNTVNRHLKKLIAREEVIKKK